MKREIKIEGMTCPHCVMAVKKELSKVSGVRNAVVEIGSAVVEHDDNMDPEKILEAIEEAGYRPSRS